MFDFEQIFTKFSELVTIPTFTVLFGCTGLYFLKSGDTGIYAIVPLNVKAISLNCSTRISVSLLHPQTSATYNTYRD